MANATQDGGGTVRNDYHGLVRTDVIPHVPAGGGTLLDVGGGVGATAARLKELNRADRVGVVDIVPASSGPGIDFSYSGSIEDAGFLNEVLTKEGPFTTILCLDILEHLVDPWQLVAKLHTSLAEDGIIVASIPNVRNYKALFPLAFKNEWTLTDAGILDRTHLRFFVRRTAIELMTHSGLELVSVIPTPGGGRRVAAFRRVTFGALNTFSDMQYIVTVRRPRARP